MHRFDPADPLPKRKCVKCKNATTNEIEKRYWKRKTPVLFRYL